MSYLRELAQRCKCGQRRAVVELYNRYNASVGLYCRPCGQRALRELSRQEAERDRFRAEQQGHL